VLYDYLWTEDYFSILDNLYMEQKIVLRFSE